MTADLQRCHDEQRRCATLLLASGSLQYPATAFQRGLRDGLADFALEEVLIMEEMERRN